MTPPSTARPAAGTALRSTSSAPELTGAVHKPDDPEYAALVDALEPRRPDAAGRRRAGAQRRRTWRRPSASPGRTA